MKGIKFHLGLDWLCCLLNKYDDDFNAILKEMKSTLVLGDNGFPNVDFLDMSNLIFDLNMKIEAEVNLLNLDLSAGEVSKEKYEKKLNKIKSFKYMNDVKRDFLKECNKNSLEISILSAELLSYFIANIGEDLVSSIKSSEKELAVFINDIYSYCKRNEKEVMGFIPALLNFLGSIKLEKNTKNI